MSNFLVFLILIGIIPLLSFNSNIVYAAPETLTYTARSPIIINGNSGFSGFPGSGTEADPYVITGYSITNPTYELIAIFNTDKYFVISNNYLDNVNYALEGIYLYNVLHGEISNNIFVNSRHAIYLDNSNDVTVSKNSISTAGESGIRLKNSNSNSITSNSISQAEYNGIWLDGSTNNVIDSNSISQVKNTSAIWIKSYSDNNTITNNTATNTYHGILISSSNSNTITNNLLKNNQYGLYASSRGYLWENVIISDSNNISFNILYNNTHYGIGLEEAIVNSTVSNNMFLRNNIPENSQAFDNGTNNEFCHNFWDEWAGPDSNNDGYVDDIYAINGNSSNYDFLPVTDYIYPLTIDFLSRPRIYAPTQGETLTGITSIRWAPALDSQSNQVNYTLYFSPDNGLSWTFIIKDYKMIEYAWDTYVIPNGTQYLFKVIASTTTGLTTQDIIDDVFTIENSDHSLTGLAIILPNGGEIVGGLVTVEWSSATDSWNHPVSYSLYYSDNSITWKVIIENVTVTAYNWNTILVPDGITYSIKVVSTCSEGLTSFDISDGYFTIRNSPHEISQVTLVSPNGGEELSGVITILWTEANDSWFHEVTYSLYYSSDNGINWILISTSISSHSFLWDTNNANDGSTLIKVVVKCSEGLTSEDTSDQPFNIKNNEESTTISSSSATSSSSTSTSSPDGSGDIIGPIIIIIIIGSSGSVIGYVVYQRSKKKV